MGTDISADDSRGGYQSFGSPQSEGDEHVLSMKPPSRFLHRGAYNSKHTRDRTPSKGRAGKKPKMLVAVSVSDNLLQTDVDVHASVSDVDGSAFPLSKSYIAASTPRWEEIVDEPIPPRPKGRTISRSRSVAFFFEQRCRHERKEEEKTRGSRPSDSDDMLLKGTRPLLGMQGRQATGKEGVADELLVPKVAPPKPGKMPIVSYAKDQYVVANDSIMYVARHLKGTLPITYHLIDWNGKSAYVQQDNMLANTSGLYMPANGPTDLTAVTSTDILAALQWREVMGYNFGHVWGEAPVVIDHIIRGKAPNVYMVRHDMVGSKPFPCGQKDLISYARTGHENFLCRSCDEVYCQKHGGGVISSCANCFPPICSMCMANLTLQYKVGNCRPCKPLEATPNLFAKGVCPRGECGSAGMDDFSGLPFRTTFHSEGGWDVNQPDPAVIRSRNDKRCRGASPRRKNAKPEM